MNASYLSPLHRPGHGFRQGWRWLRILLVASILAMGCFFVSAPHEQLYPRPDESLAAAQAAAKAEDLLVFELQPDSTIELHGAASIGGWTSRSTDISSALALHAKGAAVTALFDSVQGGGGFDLDSLSGPVSSPSIVALSVPVMSLRGGSAGMDRDMQAALKAKDNPDIRYRLRRVVALRTASNTDRPSLRLAAIGELSVAGVSREITTEITLNRTADGYFVLHGESDLLMSDFGVNPPTALFGLIRADNHMSVAFDLKAMLVWASSLTTQPNPTSNPRADQADPPTRNR